jgi:AcrR family transcriptional regulator
MNIHSVGLFMIKPEKRDEIIRAAMELIAEHGFHGAPMALVAERAGVAAGTIYRYFESKDDLIRETYACLEDQLLTVLNEDYPATQPARERFMHVGKVLVGYFIASPMDFRFIEQFHNSPFGVDNRRAKILGKRDKDIVLRLLEEARDQQILKDLPLPVLCALAFGPLVDVCRDHILEFIALDETLVEKIVAACWDGLKR